MFTHSVYAVGTWDWFWKASRCVAVQGVLSCRHDPLGWGETCQRLWTFLSADRIGSRLWKASLDHQRCATTNWCPVLWGKLSASCRQSSCRGYGRGKTTAWLDFYTRQVCALLHCFSAMAYVKDIHTVIMATWPVIHGGTKNQWGTT